MKNPNNISGDEYSAKCHQYCLDSTSHFKKIGMHEQSDYFAKWTTYYLEMCKYEQAVKVNVYMF
jgi:hypothetical protein